MSRKVAVAACGVLVAALVVATASRAVVVCPPGATLLPDLTHRSLASAEQIVRARFPESPSQADPSAAKSGYVASQQPPPCTPISPQTPIRLFGPALVAVPIHAPGFHLAPPPPTPQHVGGHAPVFHFAPPPPTIHDLPPALAHAPSPAPQTMGDDTASAIPAAEDGGVATGSAPAVDQDASVTAQIANEKALPVVYHRNQVMTVGSPNIYRVVIATKDLQAALAAVGKADGAPVVEAVKIGGDARAILTGDPSQVEITPSNSQDQLVTGDQNVEWTWYVRPKTTGTITLNLAIHDLLMTNAGLREKAAGPDLQDSITVRSTPMYWFQTLGPIWTALFGSGGIAVIIAGWFGWKRLSGKSA